MIVPSRQARRDDSRIKIAETKPKKNRHAEEACPTQVCPELSVLFCGSQRGRMRKAPPGQRVEISDASTWVPSPTPGYFRDIATILPKDVVPILPLDFPFCCPRNSVVSAPEFTWNAVDGSPTIGPPHSMCAITF